MNRYNVKQNGIIYFENKTEKNIYVIKKGKVRLEKAQGVYLVGDELSKTKNLKSGDAFGFEEVLIGEDRADRAIALIDTELIIFSKEEFSNILKGDVELGKRILSSLTKEIKALSIRIKKISKVKNEKSQGNMKSIYLYFLKSGEFKKAKQVLQRMEVKGKNLDYIKKEREKSKVVEKYDITSEDIEELISNYKTYNIETLRYILEGLKNQIFDKNIIERVDYELLNLLKVDNVDMYIEDAIEKLSEFTETNYGELIIYDIIDYYEKKSDIPRALKYANELLNQDLDSKGLIKAEKIIKELSGKVKEEGKDVSKF